MITFVTRKTKEGLESIRVLAKKSGVVMANGNRKSSNLNTKINVGLEVTESVWGELKEGIKGLSECKKKGKMPTFITNETLASLWKVKCELEVIENTGVFDVQAAKNIINTHFHADDIKSRQEALDRIEKRNKTTLSEFVENHISMCESGDITSMYGRKIAQGTIVGRKKWLKFFNRYQECRKRVLFFEDIDEDMMLDFKKYMLEYTDKRGCKKTMSQNSISSYVRMLKYYMAEGNRTGKTDNKKWMDARIATPRCNVDNVALTEEQVDELFNFNFTDVDRILSLMRNVKNESHLREISKTIASERSRECWQRSKDVFVVGCLTGQRFSDFSRINESMFVNYGGMDFIALEQLKTRKEVLIPVDKRVREILSKYGGVLPHTDDSLINDRIKLICELLGWTYSVDLTKSEGVEKVVHTKCFCDCVSTHTARRTWATNAYKRGVPLSSIMVVTGHSSEQMLKVYLKIEKKELALNAAKDLSAFMRL